MPSYTDAKDFCSQAKKAGQLPAFVLVTGNDDFLRIEAADLIRETARELGYHDREIFEMNGSSDWSQVAMAAADIGMFAAQKVIDVRIPGAKVGRKGPDGIKKLLSQPFDGVTVLFTIPTPDWASAKAAWWQSLRTTCSTVTCDTPPRAQLGRWLAARLARQGQSASPEALDYLADLVEGNLFAANQEINKLALLFDARELTRSEISQTVTDSSHFEIDSLIESIEQANASRVLRILDGLEAQDAPLPLLLAMLTREIRDIIKLQAAAAQGASSVKGVYATPGKRAAARRLSSIKLKNALLVCAELDKQVKGLAVPERDDNPWLELKSIALFLAR